MSDKVDITIIGAGVIGLAIARALAPRYQDILILEQADIPGSGISSRNSEVIHAGIYYPSNSLKAKLCVEGKAQLYRYCQQKAIPHKKIGKLIVAQHSDDTAHLQELEHQAIKNGVNDLQWWDQKKLRIEEPQLKARTALFSPSTGIIDSHALMQTLLADAETYGAQLVCRSEVTHIYPNQQGFQLSVEGDKSPFHFHSRIVINAAGLAAQTLASRIDRLNMQQVPPLYLCKGDYFSYQGTPPFQHLIYPLPEANTKGLGIHATLNLSGQVRFGPGTEYINKENYQVNSQLAERFQAAIRHYFPALMGDQLSPDYSGIRPKLQAPDAPFEDFQIHNHEQHGFKGLIQLFGIESPGLTACLAIAEHVANTLKQESL